MRDKTKGKSWSSTSRRRMWGFPQEDSRRSTTLKGRSTQRKGDTSEGDRGYPSLAGGSPSPTRATEKTQWRHATADYASAILTRNFWHM